jgi:hypothetical protein
MNAANFEGESARLACYGWRLANHSLPGPRAPQLLKHFASDLKRLYQRLTENLAGVFKKAKKAEMPGA